MVWGFMLKWLRRCARHLMSLIKVCSCAEQRDQIASQRHSFWQAIFYLLSEGDMAGPCQRI